MVENLVVDNAIYIRSYPGYLRVESRDAHDTRYAAHAPPSRWGQGAPGLEKG